MSTARVERRLAAIVCADVVGYSRLVGLDETATVAAWRAHREAILPVAAAHRGRLVGTQGDGLLFEFASVVDAVAGALAIQQTMAARAAAEPEDRRFQLRVGINLGDIIVEGADILGDGVNVAARLEALAEPGSIVVSGVVRDQVMDKLPVAFDDLGPRSVKNIARAVHAWRVRPAGSAAPIIAPKGDAARPPRPASRGRALRLAIVGLGLLLLVGGAMLGARLAGLWPWTVPRPEGVAIMVLPFESPAGQDQEYLSDGITEDIITALSKLAALANRQHLHVIGRSTAFSHKGHKVDVRRLARDLSVTHVLVGSVRRDGGRLRITAELIDAWTGRSSWAERYDRAAGDVFDIQDEVTSKVVGTLMTMLDAAGNSGTSNPLARPSGKGGEPKVAQADAERRRQEEEARARAAQGERERTETEARRRAEEDARRRAEETAARRRAEEDAARRRAEELRRREDAAGGRVPPAPGAGAPKPPMPAPASDPAPRPEASPAPPPTVAAAPPPAPAPAPRVAAAAPPPPSAAPPAAVTRPAPEVYDLVLQARRLAARDARPALLEARALLLRAVALEPGYAPGQLALADTYLRAYARRWDEADGAPQALEAALRASHLAATLSADAPAALVLRSLALAHLGRHDEAQAMADRAIARKDIDGVTLDRLAATLVFTGEPARALAMFARARQLDPVAPPAAMASEARALFQLGRSAEAAKAGGDCATEAPTERDCLEIAAAALARQGKPDAARAMVAKLKALDPGFTADTPRARFAKSWRKAADLEALVAALRQAGA